MFGGAPRLPENLQWPAACHFFAQIDLGSLPHDVTQNGVRRDLPQFNRRGTLFVFLPLQGDYLYDQNAVILYSPEDTRDLPERTPSKTTPVIDDEAQFVDYRQVSRCGRMLPRKHAKPEGFLSHSNINPFETENTPAARHKAESAYAEALAPYGIDYYVGADFPFAEAMKTTPFTPRRQALTECAARSGPLFLEPSYEWTWQSIFDLSKTVAAGCFDLAIAEVAEDAPTGRDGRISQKFVAKMEAKRTAMLGGNIFGPTSFWQRFRFGSGGLPRSGGMVDDQFEDWVAVARINKNKPLTNEVRTAFRKLLEDVYDKRYDSRRAKMMVLERMRHHRVREWDIWSALEAALNGDPDERAIAEEANLSKLEQHIRDLATKRAKDRRTTIQMFGFGECWHHAALDHQGVILLMQVEEFGSVKITDGTLQLWITQEDLAAGRFEKTFSTMEMS